MSEVNLTATNEIKNETPAEIPTINPVVKTRKQFVMTDKRRETLEKANSVRKKNIEYRKLLKEKYEEASNALQTIYNKNIESISNIDTSPPPIEKNPVKIDEKSKMSKASAGDESRKSTNEVEESSEEESDIPIKKVKVLKGKKRSKSHKSKVEVSEESSSGSSEESEEEIKPRKKSKATVKPKKAKKVVYEDSSDESDEEVQVKKAPIIQQHIPQRPILKPYQNPSRWARSQFRPNCQSFM